MKRLKTRLFAGYSALLSVCIALLGFTTACSVLGIDPDPVDEYGCPHADFIIKGKVISAEASQAIPAIRVIMKSDGYGADTVYTDASGNYEASISAFPEDQTFTLKCDDIDGATNGEFTSENLSVAVNDPTFTGGSGWYSGKTEVEQNISLTTKDGSK
jgi:putative lipoprotein (rSAM/lipoprotein system)